MNKVAAIDFVEEAWTKSIHASLAEYISIPNQSPVFDKEIHTNGLQEAAVKVLVEWVKSRQVVGLEMEVLQDKGRTPLIFMEIPSTSDSDDTVLMYGHMDKQPPMTEHWLEGLGPHKPVVRDGKLYGRGGGDDGYSIFSAITAIQLLHTQKLAHGRIVIIIEGCEESGSPDLPYYIDKLQKRIGVPSFVVCLDSGCGNYEQLWLTTSLRGTVVGDLTVQVLNEGVHSGMASGIVPSSFRILRELLERIEDAHTGKVLVPEAWAEIPEEHKEHAAKAASVLGQSVITAFPWNKGTQPVGTDIGELLLNRTWRPVFSYTGANGFPATSCAGNVLRTSTTLKLSLRLPPSVKTEPVVEALRKLVTTNVPYGATATFDFEKGGAGWMAPLLSPWLGSALESASQTYFEKPCMFQGEGGSIPFMGMLGEKFPEAQFVITGLLGPGSNAHGPNEFMHIHFFKRLTCCIASILHAHCDRERDVKRTKTSS